MLPSVARLGEEMSFTCRIMDFEIEEADSKSRIKIERTKCVCWWWWGDSIEKESMNQ